MARSRPSQAKHSPAGLAGNVRLSGRRLPPEVVVEDQRRRIAVSLAQTVARCGYADATVLDICEVASVSRRTFYDLYRDKADAFCAVHGEALASLCESIDRACDGDPKWAAGVTAATTAALCWAAVEPACAGLLVAEPFTAGPRRGYCRELLVARFAPPLHARRERSSLVYPDELEELIVGGFAGVVAARLHADRAGELPTLAPQLTEFILAPYRSPTARRASDRSSARGQGPLRA
jgi:AcrR family transcriptional regulator